LVIAALIEDRFGHQDLSRLARRRREPPGRGTRSGALPLWERPFSVKLRDFDEAGLQSLKDVRIISLRSTYGPRELQRPYTLATGGSPPSPPADRGRDPQRRCPPTASDRRLPCISARATSKSATTPMMQARTGIPRRGLWWYEHVMGLFAEAFPGVYFVLGFSGEGSGPCRVQGQVRDRLFSRSLRLPAAASGHRSEGHPVADLFGLACCTILIATPTSELLALGSRTCWAPGPGLSCLPLE
jgi:hypothetical protein